jgi:phosphoglycerate dehydrogenase-like enzyme
VLERAGLRASSPAPAASDDIPLLDMPTLIRDLGLKEDGRPVREYPQWQTPQRVTVMGASAGRLRWLQSAAPGVKLIGQPWNDPPHDEALSADGLIGWCTESFVSRAQALRWVHLGAAGVEEVLAVPSLRRRDLLVTNLQRAASPVIAEHAFAMLLCLCRAMPEHLERQRKRKWLPHALDASRLRFLHGGTLLVAGLGGIGTQVAKIAHGFGMRVLATRTSSSAAPDFIERCARPESLVDLVAEADVIVNTLPLTETTRGLFNARVFSAAKRGALFVNVARGASVVTAALTDALLSGQLAGAALDVTDPEPLPTDSPLWRMPNVVITPHIAGWGGDTHVREWNITRENLRRYVAGEPMLSVVDVSRGY